MYARRQARDWLPSHAVVGLSDSELKMTLVPGTGPPGILKIRMTENGVLQIMLQLARAANTRTKCRRGDAAAHKCQTFSGKA